MCNVKEKEGNHREREQEAAAAAAQFVLFHHLMGKKRLWHIFILRRRTAVKALVILPCLSLAFCLLAAFFSFLFCPATIFC
jgi:hypothetical protein